jgi:hypothetical protein
VSKNSDPEVPSSWAPIVGLWEADSDSGKVVYKGPQEQWTKPFGICVSATRFSEGKADITIKLPGSTSLEDEDASGRLLLGYKSPFDSYWIIGLNGYKSAYTLAYHEPSIGWRPVICLGDNKNLIPNHKYKVSVEINGSKAALDVNGVRVFDHVLERPISNSQIGLFAWGKGAIEFSDASVSRDQGTVFVVMQFSGPYQELYEQVIQPVAKDFGLRAYHAGEVFGPGVILEDIVRGIKEAKIIIAEISPTNQNVFYELGYAHALRKPSILLAEKGQSLPFDVSGYRCLFYENSIGGKRIVEDGLRQHLKAILNQ